jgi:hypothetical protein
MTSSPPTRTIPRHVKAIITDGISIVSWMTMAPLPETFVVFV